MTTVSGTLSERGPADRVAEGWQRSAVLRQRVLPMVPGEAGSVVSN